MRVLLSLRGRRDGDERGVIAVITAILATLMLIVAAFTIDFGMAYTNKRQAQSAADAGTLAAATVYQGQALTCDVLKSNTAQWDALKAQAKAEGDKLVAENLVGAKDVTFSVDCDPAKPTAFLVDYSVAKDSNIGLGQLAVNKDHLTVDRAAQATIVKGAPGAIVGACGMCFIGTNTMGTGNADYSVEGGSIHINGNLDAGPNGVWTVSATKTIGITGTVSSGQFSPSWIHEPVISDPLASMALPLSTAGLTAKTNPCTQGPGTYGSFEVPKDPDCILQPGAYVFTGALTMKNNSTLGGTGVTLYFKSPNGRMDVKNGTLANLTAPTGAPAGAPPGWPSGFAIIYDRDNTNDISAQGNGFATITGGIYGKSARLDFNGNSEFWIIKGPIVVATGTGNGNPGKVTVKNATDIGGTPLPPAPDSLQLTK